MKRVMKLLCFSVLFFVTTSCVDMLNPEPENLVTYYNFFENESDVSTAVYGIHSLFRSCYEEMPWFMASGEVADHVNTVERRVQALRNFDGTEITEDNPFLSWSGDYSVISQALLVMENLGRANLPEDRYDFYLGQALFFKAYSYFTIIQTWGDCPYISVSYELGAKERKPWLEILDIAIGDAERAAALLEPWNQLVDDKGASVLSRQIPGREAAYALLAHMYAWKGSLTNDNTALQKGIDAASFVIDKGGFSLANDPEEVCTKVLMGRHPESIFEVDLDWTEVFIYGNFHMESLYQGFPIKPYTDISNIINNTLHINGTRVLAMYPTRIVGDDTITDLRRDAYFYMADTMVDNKDTEGWALMQKRREVVLDTESSPNYPEHWFRNFAGNMLVYRLAEVILLRAEMYAKKGERGPAIIDLNRVRDRAHAADYTDAEGDLYYLIFKEREKELIAERHRRFDIVRTGFYGELSEAWGRLTKQEIEDGAVYLPVYEGAFFDNPYMRQNRFWAKQW